MDFTNRIRTAFTRAGRTPDDDIVEELAQHARAMYERARADGESREGALRRVDLQVELWRADAVLMTSRTPRATTVVVPPPADGSWVTGLWNDVRYATRLLRRHGGFSLLVILTMALGIGSTTTLFSVTYGVLLKPLPWAESDRLVRLEETRGGNRPRFGAFSNRTYLAWREAPATIEGIGVWQPRTLTLTGAGEPERIRVTAASASLLNLLKLRPSLGALFTEEQEIEQVILLSEGLWRHRFGADPGVLGRAVHLEGRPYTIVGVLPDAMGFPRPDVRAWVPFHINPAPGPGTFGVFEAVARLRQGVTPEQAADEGTARALAAPVGAELDMTIRAVFGKVGSIQVSARPLRDAVAADVRGPLVTLLVAVALLLAAATANVASLQLARSTTRRREIAIRAALGAGNRRVTRQLLLENVVLGLCGGAAGLALALAAHRVLPVWLPADFPRVSDLALDGTVAGFALSVTMIAAIIVGLAPALAARRLDLVASLSEDGGTAAGGRPRSARGRTGIMAGQLAIACVLLVGSSLLGRSFLALMDADRGFDPSGTLTARLQIPGFAFPPDRRTDIVDALLERLGQMPGVVAASYTDGSPLGIFAGTSFMIDAREVHASSRTVVPGYFAAMGMRLVGGRDFTEEDIAIGRHVFIVNRAFAREYLGEQPVGQRVRGWVRQGPEHWQVVGIVDDLRHRGVTEPAEPEVYRYRPAGERRASTQPTFIIRSAGDPLALVPTLRALAREQDSSLVFDSIMTMEERVMQTLARPRMYAALIAGFATLAVIIAGVGLFGVLSYSVAQRSRELAVRSALGARPSDLVGLVLRQGIGVAMTGIVVGLALASALVRFIAAMLYDVTTMDMVTYVAVPLVLLAVALLACVGPALRAARIDTLRLLKG